MGDAETSAELGMEQRMKIESRIRQLEGGHTYKVSGTGKAAAKHEKFEFKSEVMEYKTAADNTLNAGTAVKRKLEETGDAAADTETPEKKKKKKKDMVKEEEAPAAEVKQEETEEKLKKKDKSEAGDEATTPKKVKTEETNGASPDAADENTDGTNGTASAKKKKKKDKKVKEEA